MPGACHSRITAELQEALLPAVVPVLPRARIAARYLPAADEQVAGGDWFDAVPLPGGCVALVVGDVAGHGVAAAAAMGQLRAIVTELLRTEPDLARVLARADAFAARTAQLRAATLALAVLDPAAGMLRYATCGHPPPLLVGAGEAARYLTCTGAGPLGTGSPPVLAAGALAPGQLVLLYSDGLVERPGGTLAAGMAELAAVAAGAAANRDLAPDADPAAAERVCQLAVERLTAGRAGEPADDVTALAAQRLAGPAPALHLDLPGGRASLTTARDAFAGWLVRLDATAEDAEALHLAMVEVVTNAIEHAYPPEAPGPFELDAVLADDGTVSCRVTDHGRWRLPEAAEPDRGHGLMVAGQVVNRLHVSYPPGGGTVVELRHRLGRPAVLGVPAAPGSVPDESRPPFSVDTSIGANATARVRVCGPVDVVTAGPLTRRLLAACRGGTLPLVADLTGVTQLASAGVRALYEVSEQLSAHGQPLTLLTAPGSAAHLVLDLVRLVPKPGSLPLSGQPRNLNHN